jgi:sugar-specific transcriptional regulator TrmB
MENTILQQLGFNENQVFVYEFLLQNGTQKASIIAKNTPLQRGVVYKTLDELVDMHVIEKRESLGSVALFEPLHPSVLKSVAEHRVRRAQNIENIVDNEIGSFVSLYNLANNKPGIEFYDGIDGVKKVIYDTLKSKTAIYTYADMEQVNKYIGKINAEYAKKRDRLDIMKKVLLVDSDYTHRLLESYQKTNLDIRFVKNVPHFATVMQIYDNKVSYVTLSEEKMIGIIIQDKSIYEMHKALFKNMWNSALHA